MSVNFTFSWIFFLLPLWGFVVSFLVSMFGSEGDFPIYQH